MTEKKRVKTGRPPKPEKNKSVKISLEASARRTSGQGDKRIGRVAPKFQTVGIRRRGDRLLGELIEKRSA